MPSLLMNFIDDSHGNSKGCPLSGDTVLGTTCTSAIVKLFDPGSIITEHDIDIVPAFNAISGIIASSHDSPPTIFFVLGDTQIVSPP